MIKIDKNKTIMVVAGGTGGHISPGAALAAKFVSHEIPVRMLSLEKNRATPDFSGAGFAVDFYRAPPLPGNPFEALLFPFRFTAALLRAMALIRSNGIAVVVGMGGYSILPALFAAVLLGCDIYLCEQNAVPGRATVLFARFAKRLFLTFPDVRGRLSLYADRIVMTGNPVREGIVVEAVRHREKMEEMAQPGNPASDGLTLLILGGSQGSVQLNEMAKGCIPLFPKIHWIIQCGEKSIESMRRDLSAVGDANVELFGYHSSIHELYARADLLISRSGAGILTEAAAFALPMILVPYPYAADDHQKENALVFVKAGAARIIDTREREAGALRVEIERLIGDAGALREMGLTSYRLARLDAAERIVKEIAEAR